MKRLFFDIETSPCIGWFWRPSYRTRLSYNNVIEDAKIICVSYKWQDKNKVHTLDWGTKKDDKKLIHEFVKIMNKANEIIGHNGDRFDIPWIRTRALYHGIHNVPRWQTLDTLKSVRSNLKLPSNRLDAIGRYFDLGEKIKLYGHSKISERHDICVEFDCNQLNNENFQVLVNLSEMLQDSGEIGEMEFDIFKFYIKSLETYEKNLVVCKTN